MDPAMSDGAASAETTRRAPPLAGSDERQADQEIVPAEGSGTPLIAPMSSKNGVPEVTLPVDPLVGLMEAERRKVGEAPHVLGNKEQPCIWRVHPSIREQEGDAYEPMLVAIGPLHHRKESLKPMEEIKFRYLNKLISRNPLTNSLNNYIRVIRACEPQARKQYAEQVEMGVDDFVKMLVLDGCFIIEYFVKRVLKEVKETPQLARVRWGLSYLRRDLMLLENQIPFFVLVRLFDESRIPFIGERTEPLTLMDFTLAFLDVELTKKRELCVDQVLHLLHLHHTCLDPTKIQEEPRHCSCGQVALYPLKMVASLISILFFGLLYLVLVHKWPCHCFSTKESEVPRMIPCATELHKAGVKFRKKEGMSSYLKVSFTTEGTLEIPLLAVQESTSSKLRNFIALEQCCPEVGSHFTSYAVLIDNLINTQSDVAILQKRGIIESKLGSDEEVAKLFNALCKGTHLDYKKHYNAPLFQNVKRYCEVPHHKWRASLRTTHFSSPWSALAFIVGMVVFGITITNACLNFSRRRRK